MNIRKVFFSLVVGVLLQFSGNNAVAGGVVRCDSCDWSGYHAAASAQAGLTYVVDVPNARLTLWQRRLDKEFNRYETDELAVEPAVEQHYLYMLEKHIDAEAGQSNVVIHLTPGQPNGPAFDGTPFGGFENINAFDVVNSATVRSQLGTNLARSMAAATSSSTVLNNLAVTLNSVLLSLKSPFSDQLSFTIVITWKDGTTTTFQIDASNAQQAAYVAGKSQTANGTPIPDAAATTAPTGGNFGGQFYFDTSSSLENWVRAAQTYGIPVTGQASGSRRLSCTWDGRTLSCKYI